MKNIVVPIDFSEDSLKAIDLALLFSGKHKTNIQLVYVQKKRSDYNSPGHFEEEKEWANKKFKKLIAKYEPKLKNDSKIKYIIKSGKIFKEVVSQVESYREGMVAASTHGASGFEEFFIGSNAFKIISATEKPVLTTKTGNIPKQIKKIVMPLDVTVDTRQKVPITASLAKLFDAEVHIITVCSSRGKRITDRLSAYAKQAAGYFKAKNISYKTKSLYGENVIDLIVVYVDSVDADMITIMKEQSKSLTFIGNLTHQLLNRVSIPVMTLSNRETHIMTGFSTFGD
ncbi:MAG: universal stress protein [Bacteroidales bacterium]|nr:universal stress protein [Bacteroidales bacterium]